MDSLHIDSGVIRLCVNGDESRVIEFNPSNLLFAERFYNMLADSDRKFAEFQKRSDGLPKDDNGLPVNMDEFFAIITEASRSLWAMVDNVFGNGTAKAICGDTLSVDAFMQFMDGVAPYFKRTRAAKVAQYITPPVRRSVKRNGAKRK